MLLDLASRQLTPALVADVAGVAPGADACEPLAELCRSAERDVALTPMGRLGLLDRLVSALRTRAASARAPEPPPLACPPVLVVGMPRSGTTLLHRLLAGHPQLRALRAWEVLFPLPHGPRHDRRRDAEDRIRRLLRVAPSLHESHPFGADAVEECPRLLEPSLRSVTFWENFPLYGYAEWLTRQDPSPAYDVYARLLRGLAVGAPGPLLLKGPAHALALPAFLERFPDARLVCVHRDPTAAQASLDALVRRAHGPLCAGTDDARAARIHRAWMLAALRLGDTPGAQHVRFDDVVSRPAEVAARLCDVLGLAPLPEATLPPRRAVERHPPVTFTPEEQPRVDDYRRRWA